MPTNSLKARIYLIIEVIRITKKINVNRASKLYNIPRTTLRDRIANRAPLAKRRNAAY